MLLISCQSRREYSYHNLLTTQEIEELQVTLNKLGICKTNNSKVLEYILNYANGNYATKYLEKGWKKGIIGRENYDYTKAINESKSIGKDLNCRQFVFTVLGEDMSLHLGEEPFIKKEEFQKISENFSDKTKAQLYSVLFSSIENSQNSSDIIERWEKYHIEFSEQLQMISIWQIEEQKIINLHAALQFWEGDKVYLLEKTDPLLPYQLSCFDTEEDMLDYFFEGRLAGEKEVYMFRNYRLLRARE